MKIRGTKLPSWVNIQYWMIDNFSLFFSMGVIIIIVALIHDHWGLP